LELNNKTILEICISTALKLGVEKIFLNTFHLGEKISNFIKSQNFPIEVEIVDDGEEILDTGGGILNMINRSNDNDFLVFNPDTIWNESYVDEINNMQNYYFKNKLKDKNILISAHGNSIRALCKKLFNLDNNQISSLEIPTGNPLVIELDKNLKIIKCEYLDKERAKDLVVF